MAEANFKHLIATLVRQTRPQSLRHVKAPIGPQQHARCISATTSGDIRPTKVETAQWQPHTARPTPHQRPQSEQGRLEQLRSDPEPRPFSSFLTDSYARQHNYLRISVTERCNLRCLYCMPEEGIQLSPPERLLTTPEIVYLSELFVNQGVNKIRLTGGEPTVRKDIVELMRQIGNLRGKGLKELCLTTNGISLHRKLDAMVESGLTGVNLSLDTLDPFQFQIMTRRNGHEAVMKSINRILEMNKQGAGIKLKINCVVMRGLNEREILPFVELGRDQDLEVRFIEYMPFDGNKWSENKMLGYGEMLALIRQKYPDVQKVQDHKNDTSKTYKVPGFAGRIGFITSMTHNFCGTCNRLRITGDGNIKVCLFDNAEVSLRDLLRESNGGKPINSEAMDAIRTHELQQLSQSLGTADDLGVSRKQAQLLNVIGMAVKNKKEKHAGIGELENMKNRPMILIDDALSQRNPARHISFITSPALSHGTTFCRLEMPLQLLQNPSHGGSYSQTRLLSTGSSATHQPRQARSTVVRTINGQAVWRRIAVKPFPFLKWKRIPVLPDARTSSPPSRLHLSEPVSTPPPPPTRPSFSKTTENESEKSWASSNIQPLNHLNTSGEAHMVSIANKIPTTRSATARSLLLFSTPTTYQSLVSAQLKKGDAVAVARIAGIQAAKKTSDLIPLAHPSLAITGLNISIEPYAPGCEPRDNIIHWRSRIKSTNRGGVYIQATVDCEGKTGVEMEAMMAASVAGLTMYDMLKGVDKAMKLTETQVIKKSGGKSGDWSYDYTSRRIVETVGKGGSSGVEKPSTGRRGARRREGTSSGEERVTFDSEAPSQEPQKQEIQPSTNTDESADIKPIIEQPQGEETPAMPSADIKPIIEQRQEDESQSMPSGNHTATTSNINNTETNTSSQKEEPFKPRNHVIKDHVLIRQHEIEHGRLVPADSISPADDVRTILAEATAIDSEVSSVHDETYERAMAVVKRGYVTANDLRNARIRDWLKRSLDHGIEIPLGPAR